MLAENNAKADMIMQTNPGVVDTFNERKAEVFYVFDCITLALLMAVD